MGFWKCRVILHGLMNILFHYDPHEKLTLTRLISNFRWNFFCQKFFWDQNQTLYILNFDGKTPVPSNRQTWTTLLCRNIIFMKIFWRFTSLPDVNRYMSIFCIDENHHMDFYSKAEAKFQLHKVISYFSRRSLFIDILNFIDSCRK